MFRFLFWNLNGAQNPRAVARLARQENADLLIFAEYALPTSDFLWQVNDRQPQYRMAVTFCERLQFFTNFDHYHLKPLVESHRISICRLALPGRQPILLVAAHLPSKQHFSDDSHIFESVHLARMIEDAERAEGHRRTIVIGDLNMNPFESGLVAASGGLHAVPSRRVASRLKRTVQQQDYNFFYNPMWNHLGDRGDIAGTYYYDSGEPLCYFWNVFDQVLLRPDLLHRFSPDQVRVVTRIEGYSLLMNGIPDPNASSDHLPIVLELEF